MCIMEKDRMMSCQIAYFPIGTVDYLMDIEKVLELIKSYQVKHEIGVLSTTIQGTKENVFKLIQDIYDTMDEQNCRFTINISLSNTCGCE